MRLYDNIRLREEVEELAKRGIHKEYNGVIVGMDGDNYTVCFFNRYNHGESAYAIVNQKFLRFSSRVDKRIIQEMEEYFPNVRMDFDKCLTECDVKEYDAVELIVEKAKYAIEGVHKGDRGCVIEGVHKGDRGCVISTYAIDNHWEIIFSERGTGKDIAQIGVAREDFKIIDEF